MDWEVYIYTHLFSLRSEIHIALFYYTQSLPPTHAHGLDDDNDDIDDDDDGIKRKEKNVQCGNHASGVFRWVLYLFMQ